MENQNVKNLCSPAEWSGSLKVMARGSPNTVDASWKEMPCFLRLDSDLVGSHSNFMRYFIIIPSLLWRSNDNAQGRGCNTFECKKPHFNARRLEQIVLRALILFIDFVLIVFSWIEVLLCWSSSFDIFVL